MALTLYYHPLSSCCWKVLIALYELDVAFEPRHQNPGDPKARADFLTLWPTGKIPLLLDKGRAVPETSIIVEHLCLNHAQAGSSLLPMDPHGALETRLMDRLLDLYVMTPLQAIVGDRLRPEPDRDSIAVGKARETLSVAYGLLEQRLDGRTWMSGDEFSLADCAAAPALFYAVTLVPVPHTHARLSAYIERVLDRPSVLRVVQEAQPYFHLYPFHEALAARFQPLAFD
jgi:glutathione S-transferase